MLEKLMAWHRASCCAARSTVTVVRAWCRIGALAVPMVDWLAARTLGQSMSVAH